MPFAYDLICLSHLRWDFVYQRPQHLLSRFARERRVFFIEEPIALPSADAQPRLDVSEPSPRLHVVVPRLPAGTSAVSADNLQRALMRELFERQSIEQFVLWYYTPMAVGFTRELPRPLATVYDCMDQLSAFRGAPPEMLLRETELLRRADLVFTGGHTLYEAKRDSHPAVYAFPSSVDLAHFAQARRPQSDPPDQACVPHPRLGFYGVLDERMDGDLLGAVADLRPDWQIVMIGPVLKIEPASLPRRPNIHYLGARTYAELPAYLSGWDVALIPFARNESTRFISPTKTPEYLAAGRPVVSTAIRDVVRPYENEGLARIANSAQEFVTAVQAALEEDASERLTRVDRFLTLMSWDRTWSAMHELLRQAIALRLGAPSGTPSKLRREEAVGV